MNLRIRVTRRPLLSVPQTNVTRIGAKASQRMVCCLHPSLTHSVPQDKITRAAARGC